MYADAVMTLCLLGKRDFHFMHNLAEDDAETINQVRINIVSKQMSSRGNHFLETDKLQH